MALQASTTASSSYLCMRRVYRPMIRIKIRGNVCFVSTNLASISAAASKQPPSAVTRQHEDVVRPLQNFSPDIWGDRLRTLPFTNSEFESCSRKVEVQKLMVKDMLMRSVGDPVENILFINSLCRLGVSYHFETEIEKQLAHLFITWDQLIDNYGYDLHVVAVIFQVFRSHGYRIPCDVFNKFKIGDGTFKEELTNNIKGITSLYEASHWGTREEIILDKALAFTTSNLESLVVSQSCSHHLREYIGNILKFPYHKGMPRLEARQYISYYENDELKNHVLLKFAKNDFNRVQMLHQQELGLFYSWWKESSIASRFPHVRQRPVESFFIAIAALFEPRFALSRNVLSKWCMAITLLDDTYDAYGLFEELQQLTKAMERCSKDAMYELQGDYLKCLYETILNISDEVEEQVSKEGRNFSVSYTKEEVIKVVKSYHFQALWTHEKILPTLDEYLENAKWSSAFIVTMALLLMGMEEADEAAYQWLINIDSEFLKASCAIVRLCNDIGSNEEEENRGQHSMLSCYMKEYGVSKKKAIKNCRERIKDARKDMNEGFLVRPMSVPRQLLKVAFNIGGVVEVLYKDGNGFTSPGALHQHYITQVLFHPIPLEE